ncbi:MAG: 3-phosphoglycerate dehydrogenase family protein [Kiritimatiellae bacterium]|nr:3-phosphoglycerate dehydrogenase family protein [Kiritimatiellia bacterium]
MKKVLIPTKLDTIAAEMLEATKEYQVVQDAGTALADLAKAHPDTYALFVRSEKVSPEIMDLLPELKVVVRAGAGYNTIDIEYARSKGIDVMNTPGANSNAVAEEVVAMMLADARNIVRADATTRQGLWEKSDLMGREIAGKTVGVVGLGNIGKLLSRRLSGFDVSLLGFDPIVSPERAQEMGVELVDLETLFAQSDYITLHAPENEHTRGMIGEAVLSKMKPGATLINCARDGLIDKDALRKSKAEKNIRFLNDVYPKDEAGPKDVADIADLMLPHLGASTHEANRNAAKRAAEQLIDLDSKGVTSFVVNRDIPEGLDRQYCELANALARLCRCILPKDSHVRRLETSFYGTLEPFGDWLVVPIVAGISEDFKSSLDFRAAQKYMQDIGVDYANRDVDHSKSYVNSITVDMTTAPHLGTAKSVSVRGTITEGTMIVSRINEFDKLWYEPVGYSVYFLYDDRPGVFGTIGAKLASRGINIEDVRNPHDRKTNRSLAIMKTNTPAPDDLVAEIGAAIDAHAAFSMTL